MSSLIKMKDFSKVKRIYLLFGPACNMVCRHCTQTPIKSKKITKNTVHDDVWKLLDNYILYALKHPKEQHVCIFWGGEPLINWDFIKEVVIHYTEKYNILDYEKPDFIFSFATNGLLLTDDKVDFLNHYRVKVALSYDAPHPFAVRGKIPDSVCNTLKKLKYYSTISTFNALNDDYYLAIRCLRKKFPKVHHRLNLALMQTWDMPKDIYTYNWERVENSIKKLRIAASLGDTEALTVIYRILYPLQVPESKSVFNQYHIKGCFSGTSSFAVTLDGNIVSCHNSTDVVGKLSDTKDTVFDNSVKSYSLTSSSDCVTCRHNDICIGNCALSVRTEDGKFLSCEVFKKKFYDLLKKEMQKLSEGVSKEDKEWFEKEYVKDNDVVKNF